MCQKTEQNLPSRTTIESSEDDGDVDRRIHFYSASEAVERLSPERWNQTSYQERLTMLLQIQKNMAKHFPDITKAESDMRNSRISKSGEKTSGDIYNPELCVVTSVMGMATHITAAVELYQGLVKNKKGPSKFSKVKGTDDMYDIRVGPLSIKDRLYYTTRRDTLRVQGKPTRILPKDQPTQVIACLGAGNYSGPVENIKAIFFDNHVVVSKPHPLHQEMDHIWETILQPLVEIGALSFCHADEGPALSKHPKVDKIYFTGGAETAKLIQNSTDKPVVVESGGTNPMLIVPSNRKWSKWELQHHAKQIVTFSKL